MSLSPLDSQLFQPLFEDEVITAVFSDASFIQKMVQVEATLAKVQGALGIIPQKAAGKIVESGSSFKPDIQQMHASIDKSGMPVIALVNQLKSHVGQEAKEFVHFGATTQDIMDTARVLQLRDAISHFESMLQELIPQLTQLADQHRHTLMVGRTHAQQALPYSFGLKVANWLSPLLTHQERLQQLKPRLLVVQFGGAAGTLSALGNQGTAVQSQLAKALELGLTRTPWHTQRDNFVEFAGWLSLLTGSLAKMAQDIILMCQSEVGELRETADSSRGGSSTMPQKSNPMISELIIASARTNASLLGNMHQALIQEQERATHGWQMEWLTLPQMVGLTAVALQKATFLSQNLVVNRDVMAQNIKKSNGLLLAEAINFALAPAHMSRTDAKKLIRESCHIAYKENRHLIEVLQEKLDVPLDWQFLQDEANHLGSANDFIDRVLREAEEI